MKSSTADIIREAEIKKTPNPNKPNTIYIYDDLDNCEIITVPATAPRLAEERINPRFDAGSLNISLTITGIILL